MMQTAIPPAPNAPGPGPVTHPGIPLPPSAPMQPAAPATTVHPVAVQKAVAHHGVVMHLMGYLLGPHALFLLMLLAVLLFVLLWMPATRELLKAFFGTLLIPVFSVIITLIFRRISKTVLLILESHWILFLNLVSTHNTIFPDIQEEE